ncbi:hypothetical protein ACFVUY_21585 [Kitasatospora sp. NPDC058063]|uniref:hypothetical protein n=1 Tax=unclassified Kitasatospora TaxID=2633591 RepID=UPI0036D898F6
MLPNAVLQDRRLSLAARGLLADLLSRPERWREDARQIADSSTDSRAAVRKALRELIEAGYYRVERNRMPDGTIRSEAHVYDTPQIPGLREARELLEAVNLQAEPSVPHPASGPSSSGDAGAHCVKNLVKEPSLPGAAVPPKESAEPRPEAAGGHEGISVENLDGPLRVAAHTLQQALNGQRRLRLGEAEMVELAPLVAEWLAVGSGPAELAAALLSGLPQTIHSPVGVVRSRLLRKLPMRPAPAERTRTASRMHECDECRDPVSRPGLCRGASPRRDGANRGAEVTARGMAKVRAAMGR